MKKKILLDEISHLLESLTEQHLTISRHEGNIPRIEIDLMKENMRRVYEALFNLEKLNVKTESLPETDSISLSESEPEREMFTVEIKAKEESPVPTPPPAPKAAEPVVTAPIEKPEIEIPEPVIQHQPEIHPEVEASVIQQAPVVSKVVSEVPEPGPEPIKPVTLSSPQSEPKPVRPTTVKESRAASKTTADLFSMTPIVADKFKDDTKSLNETIAGTKTDKSIGARMQQGQISDIKAAIGINEKFKILNELFNGQVSEYNEAIARLNNLPSFDAAMSLMNELSNQHQWNVTKEAYVLLRNIVERRYK